MSYVFSPPAITALPVRGSADRFPVRRVYCVGRNYAEHAIEMGGDPNKEPPFFFQKNPDNLVAGRSEFRYPSATKDVHHEIELVVFLSKGGENIPVDQALDHVFGYAVGLDMTRRDLQGEAKKMGRPWESGKAFEESAPVGEIVRASDIGHPEAGAIWLKVNGQTVQEGDLNQLIWKVPEAISYLSGLFRLGAGDVIMTGTPAGVGPVKRGDELWGHIDGIGDLQVKVV
ncbi:MAG TPA: fumarylacetoacetate hydrolase family protein [Propylenella sp.]|nr:fumarylacetoacetate hydrolase family protein [Propylenella sp.]